MDDIRVWAEARTSDQVLASAEGGQASGPALRGSWSFDDSVNPLGDASGLGASAVLLGGAAVGAGSGAVSLPEIVAGLTDADGSETLFITIGGVPAGAGLANVNGVIALTGGAATLSVAELAGLRIVPPAGFSGVFELTITATAVDGAAPGAATQAVLTVTVLPLAGGPGTPAQTIFAMDTSLDSGVAETTPPPSAEAYSAPIEFEDAVFSFGYGSDAFLV
jgi:hypothetical protein